MKDQLCWSSAHEGDLGTGYVACTPQVNYGDSEVVLDAPDICGTPGNLSASNTTLMAATCGDVSNAVTFSAGTGHAATPTQLCEAGNDNHRFTGVVLFDEQAALVDVAPERGSAVSLVTLPAPPHSQCPLTSLSQSGLAWANCADLEKGWLISIMTPANSATQALFLNLVEMSGSTSRTPKRTYKLTELPADRQPVGCVVLEGMGTMFVALSATTPGGDDGVVYKANVPTMENPILTLTQLNTTVGDSTGITIVSALPNSVRFPPSDTGSVAYS